MLSIESDKQNLSSAYFALANQLLDDGKSPEALALMEQSYDLVEGIAATDPRNALFQRSLATKRLGLCRVHLAMEQPQKALPYCKSSVEAMERLAAADAGSGDKQLALADAHRVLGATLLAGGNARIALEQERHALAMFESFPTATQDHTVQLYSLRAHITAGNAEIILGETKAGLADMLAASQQSDKLVQQDPEQPYNHVDRLHAKLELAGALAANGQCAEAASLTKEAMSEAQFLQRLTILPPGDSMSIKSIQQVCLSPGRV